jgi:hypothetical protein
MLYVDKMKSRTKLPTIISLFKNKLSLSALVGFVVVRSLQSCCRQMTNMPDKHNIMPQHDLDVSSSKKNGKLEFVHITKTGGTAIERAGAQTGILWGACHFLGNMSSCAYSKPDWRIQQISIPNEFQSAKRTADPWHFPPAYLKEPYMYGNATLFSVVRNPYDRVISEFYCPWRGYDYDYRHKHNAPLPNPSILNSWIQKQIRDSSDRPRTHFYPQHHYLYNDHNGTLYVDHVLRLETLAVDFGALMSEWNLNVTLEKVNVAHVAVGNMKLTAEDLSNTTIALVNSFYAKDFKLLGYDMREVGEARI